MDYQTVEAWISERKKSAEEGPPADGRGDNPDPEAMSAEIRRVKPSSDRTDKVDEVAIIMPEVGNFDDDLSTPWILLDLCPGVGAETCIFWSFLTTWLTTRRQCRCVLLLPNMLQRKSSKCLQYLKRFSQPRGVISLPSCLRRCNVYFTSTPFTLVHTILRLTVWLKGLTRP